MKNHTHKIKHQVIYYLEYGKYHLPSDKYKLRTYAVYKGEEDGDSYELSISNLNILCDKIRVELDLPEGGGTKDKLQFIVNIYDGNDYGKEEYINEIYNKTTIVNLTNKQTYKFSFPVAEHNCRNMGIKVLINEKIVLKKVILFECGE